jgi:hypothetical protein
LAASANAQTPGAASQLSEPLVGFVSPYEVARTLRGAGFEVLAPPLREGTTYVVRASDFRGLLMRVVVDARTGAIRDATRIVPGPGRYGQLYRAPPPYDPADYNAAVPMLGESEMGPPMAPMPSMSQPQSALPLPLRPPLLPMPATVPASPLARPLAAAPAVPLPRPRPAALALREGAAPAIAAPPQSALTPSAAAPVKANVGSAGDAAAAPEPAVKPQVSTEIITAAPPPSIAVAPSAPGTPAARKKPSPVSPPLND